MNQNKPVVSARAKWLKRLRNMHKWPGILMAVFLILFSVSGIVLNHRNWFSAVDVSRHLLPPGYQFDNWNLAAVKGAEELTPNDYVVYGNIGAWLTNDSLNRFIDLNQGFPKGVDNRKIEAMLYTANGELLAGTLFGLYRYDGNNWIKINLPQPDIRITDLAEADDEVLILTRSHLITTNNFSEFKTITLPAAENYDNKVTLFRTLWTLHSGELFGHWGKIIVDFLGLGLIFLSITGVLHWLFPKWIKQLKKKGNPIDKQKKAMQFNLKWHNKVGYTLAGFLVITAITGIFLRPPLLIAIANSKVGKVPFSVLDNDNAWNDKLRRIIYIDEQQKYLVSTSDGFVVFDKQFEKPAKVVQPQPPVSVMGCTVLEWLPDKNNTLLVGSFSGLFEWDFETGTITNAISQQPHQELKRRGSPISANMVSGYIKTSAAEFMIDYNKGLRNMNNNQLVPVMPMGIKDATPMSLWNVGLEVHTGRIFEHLLGPFYILFIPLMGIMLLMLLISGFFIWWLAYRNKKKHLNNNIL